MKKNVLVTGGAGFIGSNLASFLSKSDNDVFIIDDLTSGNLQNLTNIKHTLIRENLMKINQIKLLPQFDVVFHFAASVGRQKSIDFPIQDSKTNLLATIELLNFMVLNKIPKIVYSSSAAIFGELKNDCIDEEHPLNPDSPYGVSKLAAEKMIFAFSHLYNFEAVSLRYFNIFGINQRYDLYGNVIPIFVHLINNNKPISIYGDGEQTRDFLNVNDVVKANLLATTAGIKGCFNVGSGKSYSINYLVSLLKQIYKREIKVNYLPKRSGDVLHCRANIKKIAKELNFVPDDDFLFNLRAYINWTNPYIK
jgi:nucleoside-diphosphate-sugar epimerase